MFYIRFIVWKVCGRHLIQIATPSGEQSCTCIIALIIFGSRSCVLVISRLYQRGSTRRRIVVTLTRIRYIHVVILMQWRIGLGRGRQRRSISESLADLCSISDSVGHRDQVNLMSHILDNCSLLRIASLYIDSFTRWCITVAGRGYLPRCSFLHFSIPLFAFCLTKLTMSRSRFS